MAKKLLPVSGQQLSQREQQKDHDLWKKGEIT